MEEPQIPYLQNSAVEYSQKLMKMLEKVQHYFNLKVKHFEGIRLKTIYPQQNILTIRHSYCIDQF